ncbi:MAG: lysylphosphatidylglycerol synthase transmembrane domain-containing protein [Pirellulales bacterium]
MPASRWKNRIVLALKVSLAVGILAFLIVQAQRNDSFSRLRDQPKDWGYLLLAGVCCLAGVALTFVRWHLLVRALEIPFRLRDAFRLGFLAYLLNFVSLGSVGGDLFKALFVARERPTRRTEAVATVVIDRLFGLYALFLVASAAIVITDVQHQVDNSVVRAICDATLVSTAIGTVGIVVLLVPAISGRRLVARVESWPWIGPTLARLVGAVRMYQQKRPLLVLVTGMSLLVHVLFVLCFYFIALGLPGNAPTLAEHFLVIPLSMVAGALPVTPSGLGALEAAVEFFYQVASPSSEVGVGNGMIAALCYRFITVVIALIGACYYLTCRREVAEVMHEAEA